MSVRRRSRGNNNYPPPGQTPPEPAAKPPQIYARSHSTPASPLIKTPPLNLRPLSRITVISLPDKLQDDAQKGPAASESFASRTQPPQQRAPVQLELHDYGRGQLTRTEGRGRDRKHERGVAAIESSGVLSVSRSLGLSLGRSVSRSLGRSIGRSLDRSVDRSVARSIARLLG